MGMPSGMELFIIVAAIVLLFGGKKIPELAKGLGQGIKNFKSAVKEDDVVEASADKENIEAKAEETTTTSTESKTNA
ncbi:MAG: twin-arginine translocase TatA/TatE family subunit [Campylobacteraceae bacterium]|jgi:sec-independent protein translocase protein TatA|nr:twin-arginine translocase TatA/TatE family subunit [Campylobacteraceae bacterium]MBT3881904.1 twin-arginine translocase TatA/TatE family subunit [Campylobacteraceae bacterium]MBT4030770.1 twin-arginine translocase TatA/TatE family subunit [Campylobacteraceae bacterium]MBT4178741.1 twin-arginine translocase TatA/TatE family subunit [Campylobacteraceae bacterium]MBT4572104.1 twin-arginine translocase TatA/TatE family subunit [Campylobacteraceae bacterium]